MNPVINKDLTPYTNDSRKTYPYQVNPKKLTNIQNLYSENALGKSVKKAELSTQNRNISYSFNLYKSTIEVFRERSNASKTFFVSPSVLAHIISFSAENVDGIAELRRVRSDFNDVIATSTIPWEGVVADPDEGLKAYIYIQSTGNSELLEKLIENKLLPQIPRNRFGDTPLHWAVSKHLNKALVELLKNKELVNQLDVHGNTALHLAVGTLNVEAVKAILPHGDVNCENADSLTPIFSLSTVARLFMYTEKNYAKEAKAAIDEIYDLLVQNGAKFEWDIVRVNRRHKISCSPIFRNDVDRAILIALALLPYPLYILSHLSKEQDPLEYSIILSIAILNTLDRVITYNPFSSYSWNYINNLPIQHRAVELYLNYSFLCNLPHYLYLLLKAANKPAQQVVLKN